MSANSRWEPPDELVSPGRRAFWRMPVSLFRAQTSIGRAIWEHPRRAGMASLLPVIAASTWLEGEGDPWTRPAIRRREEWAFLAGIGRNTVLAAADALEGIGLLVSQHVQQPLGLFSVTTYRVHRELYPISARSPSDPSEGYYREIPQSLFTGGIWRQLQRPAARHVLLAICCLDNISSEGRLLSSVEFQDPDEGQDRRLLLKLRREAPVHAAAIADATGIRGTSLQRALKAIEGIQCSDGTCLLQHERTAGYWIDPDVLASGFGLEAQRAHLKGRRARYARRVSAGLASARRARGRRAGIAAGHVT